VVEEGYEAGVRHGEVLATMSEQQWAEVILRQLVGYTSVYHQSHRKHFEVNAMGVASNVGMLWPATHSGALVIPMPHAALNSALAQSANAPQCKRTRAYRFTFAFLHMLTRVSAHLHRLALVLVLLEVRALSKKDMQ
jgi:hypothetical protein